MAKNSTIRADCRRRLRELEQIYRATASALRLDKDRLSNKYWTKKADQYQREAELLLSKAETAKAKQKELEDNASFLQGEIKSNLLRAGICKTVLNLTGKMADLVLMENPRNTVEVYIHLVANDVKAAEKVYKRDIAGRASTFLTK